MRHRVRRGLADREDKAQHRLRPGRRTSEQAPHILPQPGQVDRAEDIDGRSGRLQRIRAGQIRWNAVFVPTAGGATDHFLLLVSRAVPTRRIVRPADRQSHQQLGWSWLARPEEMAFSVRRYASDQVSAQSMAAHAPSGGGDDEQHQVPRLEDGTQQPDAYGWITALRAPAIKKLMADDGPLQLSLFDEQDLAEITSDDFPGERLVACRNPVLAAGRARKREDLLAATEKLLAPVIARVRAGRLQGAGEIGVEVGKVITKYKTGKHFAVAITDDRLTVTRRQDQIDAETALDGFYVLRTPIPASQLDGPAVVTAYKNLKYVERDFRHIKADDLDLPPVYHYLEERVRAHVLICMLACYLTWHLRKAWAPLTFTDEDPPAPENLVAPARRSARAQAKASYQHDPAGRPYRSFRDLLEHLATLTRNEVRFTATRATIPMLAEPTSAQREAFDLLGVPIPLTLK